MSFDRDITSINSLIKDISPLASVADSLEDLFGEFSSLLENVIDKLDELENTIFQLQETVAAQQKDIEKLQQV